METDRSSPLALWSRVGRSCPHHHPSPEQTTRAGVVPAPRRPSRGPLEPCFSGPASYVRTEMGGRSSLKSRGRFGSQRVTHTEPGVKEGVCDYTTNQSGPSVLRCHTTTHSRRTPTVRVPGCASSLSLRHQDGDTWGSVYTVRDLVCRPCTRNFSRPPFRREPYFVSSCRKLFTRK